MAKENGTRQIEVDIDVFALIWANRKPSESSENEVLKRILVDLLGMQNPPQSHLSTDRSLEMPKIQESNRGTIPGGRSESLEVFSSKLNPEKTFLTTPVGKIRWVDDVRTALQRLGGVAPLHQIYKTVEEIRRSAGRSNPESLEATVRRTIEDHSSDSENFRGADLFKRVSRGEWSLR